MCARFVRFSAVFAALAFLAFFPLGAQAQKIGIFDGQQDVGTVVHPGHGEYDAARNIYTVTGSGENMWFGSDNFHYVWKKVSGDVALSADIAILGDKGNNHRKGVLIIRETLDGDSRTASLAVHADGLTSLQFRDQKGANMREVQANVSAPRRVRIEKRGEFVYAFIPGADGKLHPSGSATKLAFDGEFYIGLGVCSHDANDLQTAVFSNVKLVQLPPAKGKLVLVSALEAGPVAGDRRVQYVSAEHFEAPNWTRDGGAWIFNQEGSIRRLEVGASAPVKIDTAPLTRCNNDHGISPDGASLAISCSSAEDAKSRIYIVPLQGGKPLLVTKNSASYWHGWSPDGKTLAFATRRGDLANLFTIGADGEGEKQLTAGSAADDGPDYSPDGQWIYFNSDRTGRMQIWRMKADGSAPEQFLTSERNDWFPHISPDGQWMVYLSYEKGVTGHPPNKDVELHLVSMKDKKVSLLATMFGGQGTINVPSWSPDSKKIAYVSYELLPEEALTAN